jgi:hypothetical protein
MRRATPGKPNMPSFDQTLALLGKLVELETRYELERRENLTDATLPKAFRDERDAMLAQQIDNIRREKLRGLGELVRYPPFHVRHFDKLADYYKAAGCSFDKSVFIMTKFPDGNTAEDKQLQEIIDAVRDAVRECGHVPRLASDASFHAQLWDNVELYLLGSSRGIAILESKYRPELNPNVAMEWGWMRGMGRDILPLVEKGFAYRRADWGGLIEHEFDWGDPRTVRESVKKWLDGGSSAGA